MRLASFLSVCLFYCSSLLVTGRLPTENTYRPSPAISLLAHSNKEKKIGMKMCHFTISPGPDIRSQVGYNLGVSVGISTFQRINGLKEPKAFQNTNCTEKNPRLFPQLTALHNPAPVLHFTLTSYLPLLARIPQATQQTSFHFYNSESLHL